MCGGIIIGAKKNKIKCIFIFLEKYEFIAPWIALVLTVYTIWGVKQNVSNLYNIMQNTNNGYLQAGNNVVEIDGNANVVGNSESIVSLEVDKSINSQVLGILFPSEDGDYVTNALLYAECYYNVKQYDSAFRIYYMLSKEDEVLGESLTNLGYMYANGLGCEIDEEQAIKLYDSAIELGYSRALSNKVALLLRKFNSDSARCISLGLKEGNSYIEAFLTANYSSKYEITLDEYMEFFKSASEEEIFEFIATNLYKEEMLGVVKLNSAPTSDIINRYEAVGTYNWYDDANGQSGTIYIYNHYRRYCNNIGILQEGIVYSFEKAK